MKFSHHMIRISTKRGKILNEKGHVRVFLTANKILINIWKEDDTDF